MNAAMLAPAFALVALTVVVYFWMYTLRLRELHRGRIDAQAVATSAKMASLVTDTRAADNFRNLFELPVLFYAALLIAAATPALSTTASLRFAWAFVALRVLHSLVHCSYNRVMHRFALHVASTLVLFAWWAYLALQLFA
jgi:hypothetical protein